jgi:cleavage and polyadenylation specificity factor subunit 3
MAPEDLREHAGLSTTAVVCRHHLAFPHASSATVELMRWTLECSFGAVDDLPEARKQLAIDKAKTGQTQTYDDALDQDNDNVDAQVQNVEDQGPRLLAAWLVMGCIKLWCYHDGGLTLEWEGNQINDTLADAVIATLFTASTSPAAVKRKSSHVPFC